MGIISRLFGRAGPATESRDAAFYGLSASLGDAYTHGSHAGADRVAAVAGCVRLISASLSALPATLTVDGPAGSQPAPPTATAWALLRRPSLRHSWPAFIAWVARSILLDGNAVAWLQVDGRGSIVSMSPVPWAWLTPEIIGTASGPRLAFRVWNRTPEAQILGLPDRLLEGDILHFKAQSDAGLIGQSVLARARGPVAEGHEIERLALANWRNGARPSAALTLANTLDDNRRKRFREEFLPAFTGALNTGKVPLLEGGMEFKQIGMNSVDAQFIETRQLNTSQIAMLFGVPEVLLHIGQRLPTDMAQFVTQFAQLALAPLVTSVEAEFSHAVLPPGMSLRLDLDGLMRGSFSAQVAALVALKQSGVVTANDARAELNWPPIKGGDELATGPAPSWPADAKGMPHLAPSPGPTGDAPPQPGTNQGDGAG